MFFSPPYKKGIFLALSRNPKSSISLSSLLHHSRNPNYQIPTDQAPLMAKKRKLNSKSTESPATRQKKQQKQQQKKQKEEEEQQLLQQQQQQQQQLQQHVEEEHEEVEEEDDVEEEEEAEEEEDVEEEEEEDDEDDEEEEEDDDDEDDDGDDEPIQKLLEPFNKDQLVTLLCKAAESHSDVVSQIKKMADEDPVHRKIFVHGLGWDATADTLRNAFSQYGEIEDCKSVTDKFSGKSKGYGFILFKSRVGARKALKEPQKKIGNRMTACQLAAVGPVPVSGSGSGQVSAIHQHPVSEYTQRKIYVSNVAADIEPQKLTAYFGKYGEIEEGPLGLDKQTGKPKGFCLFVYKSVEGAKKALEEPHKKFEGHVLHCQKAIDGPKPGKQQQNQRGQQFARNESSNLGGGIGGSGPGAGLMGQTVGGVGFNQGGAGPGAPGLNPALGQALTALLASQGAGLGLNNLLGTLSGGMGGTGVGASGHGMQGGYGSQGVAASGIAAPSGVLGGYGSQGGLQAAYPSQQIGQGGSGRSQHGHIGGVAPYSGH